MRTNLEQSSTAVHHASRRLRAVTAWELIAITLRYYRTLILLGYGVVSVVGALILAIVVVIDGREIRVVFLLATGLFVAGSMTIAILINTNESSERRLRLLLLLPTRRTTVYWARFLTPLLVHTFGIAIGLLLITIERLTGLAGPGSRSLHTLIYAASITGFYIYFPTLIPDLTLLWRGGRRPQAAGAAAAIAIGMIGLASLQLTGAWKSPAMAWLMPLPALACAAISLFTFHRRPSFAA
jgi:ABC-type transport system involved in multi-copper enzyme maturation permease subunit